MKKFIALYNKNRKKFWKVVIIIVFIFILTRLLNYRARLKNKNMNYDVNQLIAISKQDMPYKSAISNNKVDEYIFFEQNNLVSKFVEYCNSNKIKQAYDLLSMECKEDVFPTLSDFENCYYKNIFNKEIEYSLKNWDDSIYQIKYKIKQEFDNEKEDSSIVKDYIKIVDEDGQSKLNINGFFGREQIDKQYEENNIKIRAMEKNCFMDYEIYTFEIENNTNSDVFLDELKENNKLFLTDSKNVNHYVVNNEIIRDDFNVKSHSKGKIRIKFDNPYIIGRKISSITFNNIIVSNGTSLNMENISYKIDL